MSALTVLEIEIAVGLGVFAVAYVAVSLVLWGLGRATRRNAGPSAPSAGARDSRRP